MKNVLIAVSMISALAFSAGPARAQYSGNKCVVDPQVPETHEVCRYYWKYSGGAGRNGHVTPYQDEYGRDVGPPGHMYH